MKHNIQKNSIKMLAALLIAAVGMTFTACSGDDNDSPNNVQPQPQPQPQQPQEYTMTVLATKGGDAQTRALADNGSTLTATWATTEHVYVKKGDTWATGSLQPQTAGATAKLFGKLSGVTFAAGDNITLQFPKSGDISYAGQTGTLVDIAENFDWATANVTIANVTDNGVSSVSSPVDFESQQAIIKFTLQDKGNSNAAISPTALTINDGTSDIVSLTSIPAATYTTNGAGVLYVALPAVSNKTITLTATVGSDTYKLTTDAAKSFTAGKFYRVIAPMISGSLNGKFSVAANTKVYFSQGNLQAVIASGPTNTYNYTASSWKFADNQWEFIGNNPGNTSFAVGTTVDLFGWVGKSAFWDTYGLSTFEGYNNIYFGTSANDELKSDWGKNIGDGNTWRTLTADEWNYLFTDRTTGGTVGSTSQARYTVATIRTDVSGGVNGIILFPDGVDFTSTEFTTLGTVNGTSTWGTKCTSAQWTVLEGKGCVFLPAAGSRNVTIVQKSGTSGHYWSSSTDDVRYAYGVYFGEGNLDTKSYSNRYFGRPVRLVRLAE